VQILNWNSQFQFGPAQKKISLGEYICSLTSVHGRVMITVCEMKQAFKLQKNCIIINPKNLWIINWWICEKNSHRNWVLIDNNYRWKMCGGLNMGLALKNILGREEFQTRWFGENFGVIIDVSKTLSRKSYWYRKHIFDLHRYVIIGLMFGIWITTPTITRRRRFIAIWANKNNFVFGKNIFLIYVFKNIFLIYVWINISSLLFFILFILFFN